MLIKRPGDVRPSQIAPRSVYLSRRELIKAAAAALALGVHGSPAGAGARLEGVRKSAYSASEKTAGFKDITTYNNYYEFGTDKHSPADAARRLSTSPWTLVVDGEVRRPRT